MNRDESDAIALVSEMKRQNITLSLPKDVLVGARHLAVERGESLSGMLARLLERMVDDTQISRGDTCHSIELFLYPE